MKYYTISREVILEGLAKVIGAIDRKLINPVLGHCLVCVSERGLLFTATDLEIQINFQTYHQTLLRQELKFTLPAKKIYDFCRALPKNSLLELTIETKRLQIKSEASFLDVSTFSAEDFPVLGAQNEEQQLFKFKQKQLKQSIESVLFAMAVADIRYYLNGLYLQVNAHDLDIVATDGHRLAISHLRLEEVALNNKSKESLILSRRAVIEILRLLSDHDEEGLFYFSAETAYIVLGQTTFSCQIVDGKYPDYRRVLPKELPYEVRFEREAFKQALSLVQPILSAKDKGVLFEFLGNKMVIKAVNTDSDQVKAWLDLESPIENIKIGFNLNYIVDFIAFSKSPYFSMRFKDDSAGVVFSSEQSSYYVVMPLIL
jgi:DNA polymerase-3 subunit beta